jgi:hypothetical protein
MPSERLKKYLMSSTISDLILTRSIERRRERVAGDPVMLTRASGIEPDEWQTRALHSTSNQLLFNCARQTGKSTVTAILAVHTAISKPGSLVLIVAPSLRQSAETFRKAMGVYRALAEPEPEAESVLRLELQNGSRIISLPGSENNVRGYSSVNLLIVDEAARVESDLIFAVRPMLSVSRGRLVALSTPAGSRGWFWEAWTKSSEWDCYEVPASKCPRISAEFLAEEKRQLPAWVFEQEYECRFLDSESQCFTRAEIDGAFAEEVEAWVL